MGSEMCIRDRTQSVQASTIESGDVGSPVVAFVASLPVSLDSFQYILRIFLEKFYQRRIRCQHPNSSREVRWKIFQVIREDHGRLVLESAVEHVFVIGIGESDGH